MDYSFRETVASNPLLYSIYLQTLRNRKGDNVRLPSAKDDLYLDGYPRSGNTYFKNLTTSLYPDLKFASHLHVTAGIKIALKKGLPTFILIRQPKDTITSWVCRKVFLDNAELSQDFVDKKVKQYVNYYKFILLCKDEIEILVFNKIIEKQYSFVQALSNALKLKIYTEDNFEEALINHNKSMKLKEENKNEGASSLPNEKRNEFKEKNGWLVEESKYFEEAEDIYIKIIS